MTLSYFSDESLNKVRCCTSLQSMRSSDSDSHAERSPHDAVMAALDEVLLCWASLVFRTQLASMPTTWKMHVAPELTEQWAFGIGVL